MYDARLSPFGLIVLVAVVATFTMAFWHGIGPSARAVWSLFYG